MEQGYEGKDWLGLITAGLLYFDLRRTDKDKAVLELVDALKSVTSDQDVLNVPTTDENLRKQREIFERDFKGRVYQKEGQCSVQYGFEAFNNCWVDWSTYYWEETCTKSDGTFMSSQELGRKKFEDIQFISDRYTFLYLAGIFLIGSDLLYFM